MAGGTKVIWSPFTKGYLENPYPHLEECRLTNPVQKSEILENAWFFFSHEDVSTLLRDPMLEVADLSSYFREKEPQIFRQPGACPYLSKGTAKWPMYLNGQEHKSLRALIGKGLKEVDLAAILERSLKVVLSEYESKESFDVVDFCTDFIFYVVKDLFGISNYESVAHVKKYSNLLARSQDLYIPKPVYQEINEGFLWGQRMFGESPFRENLEKHATQAGIDFSDDELYSVMAIMLMASFETSKDNLSESLYELLKEPGLVSYAAECSPQQAHWLIEELIRFSSPLQYTIRKNKTPLQYKEYNIPAGTKLFLCLASANRDENEFIHPNRIIPDRNPNEHLSFGYGAHFCLGAQIARQELRYCLQPMARFLQNFRPAAGTAAKWSKQIFMRTIESVQVEKINGSGWKQ